MARILAVDDSPTVLSSLERLLQKEGHEVHTATDALSAIAALAAMTPDLVLLDIMLPGVVGGIEICSLMRSRPKYNSVPIIMVTALSNRARLAQFTGADAYITKPFSEEDLLNVVNDYLYVDRTALGKPAWYGVA